MLRKILTLALLLIFSFINHAQILLNPAQITNIAAKQRMYSQRLSRAKVSKIYNVDADNMQRQLTTGIILFEENLKVLGSYVASNEYKLKVDQVNYLWKDFIKQIESDDVSAANKIIKTNSELLNACNEVVKELNVYFKSKGGSEKSNYESQIADFCATSGRLRYLSQRLSLYYVYAFNNASKPPVELKNTMDLFETTLSTLLTCQFNNSEIDENISKVYIEWNKLKSLVGEDGKIVVNEKSVSPETMIENCDRILALGEKITGMYVALLK